MGRKTVNKITFIDYSSVKITETLWDFTTKTACGATIKINLWCIQYI